MTDRFSTYHPLVNFIFFLLVLLCAMCLMNPISLAISLAGGLCYHHKLAQTQSIGYLIPIAGFAIVINPLVNHQGMTILTYLPTENPLTLESILYGIAAGAMLVAVFLWFSCLSHVITSDKFIYLFGRVIPSLSLVLSMTLGFIPKFKCQYAMIAEGQRCIHSEKEGRWRELKIGATSISILATWALEQGVETADSMRSRGYGLPNRTTFSIYQWSSRDTVLLLWILLSGGYVMVGWMMGLFSVQYFPSVKLNHITAYSLSVYFSHLALCLTPIILRRREEKAWQRTN